MEKSSVSAPLLKPLPPIPAKRYFTIGEVAELCQVKAYVLRYWEQEFTQLKPMKRRGNRRYYQHHEVLLIRRIRDLLYEQGFTIVGARMRLQDQAMVAPAEPANGRANGTKASEFKSNGPMVDPVFDRELDDLTVAALQDMPAPGDSGDGAPRDGGWTNETLRAELSVIRRLLTV
jgi:DNA-binding transcriptional MerR regulator